MRALLASLLALPRFLTPSLPRGAPSSGTFPRPSVCVCGGGGAAVRGWGGFVRGPGGYCLRGSGGIFFDQSPLLPRSTCCVHVPLSHASGVLVPGGRLDGVVRPLQHYFGPPTAHFSAHPAPHAPSDVLDIRSARACWVLAIRCCARVTSPDLGLIVHGTGFGFGGLETATSMFCLQRCCAVLCCDC